MATRQTAAEKAETAGPVAPAVAAGYVATQDFRCGTAYKKGDPIKAQHLAQLLANHSHLVEGSNPEEGS